MNYTYLPYLLTKYNTSCVLCMVNLLGIPQHPDSKIGHNIVPCFHLSASLDTLHLPPPVRGSGMDSLSQSNNPTCF